MILSHTTPHNSSQSRRFSASTWSKIFLSAVHFTLASHCITSSWSAAGKDSNVPLTLFDRNTGYLFKLLHPLLYLWFRSFSASTTISPLRFHSLRYRPKLRATIVVQRGHTSQKKTAWSYGALVLIGTACCGATCQRPTDWNSKTFRDFSLVQCCLFFILLLSDKSHTFWSQVSYHTLPFLCFVGENIRRGLFSLWNSDPSF